MRIISGKFKGKKIYEPKDTKTRPLKDLTKESLFNIINHSNKFKIEIEQAVILDLFSGVGSFGIECLSRGVKKVVFIENYAEVISILKKNLIIVIGKTFGHLEQSCFLKENYSIIDGRPPEINLLNEKNNGEALLYLIENKLIQSAHDVSNGGLIVALSEMSIGTDFGIKIQKPKKLTNLIGYFFGEDQGRYVIEIDPSNLDKVVKLLNENNIYHDNLGVTQKEFFEIEDEMKISNKELFKVNNHWYNNY